MSQGREPAPSSAISSCGPFLDRRVIFVRVILADDFEAQPWRGMFRLPRTQTAQRVEIRRRGFEHAHVRIDSYARITLQPSHRQVAGDPKIASRCASPCLAHELWVLRFIVVRDRLRHCVLRQHPRFGNTLHRIPELHGGGGPGHRNECSVHERNTPRAKLGRRQLRKIDGAPRFSPPSGVCHRFRADLAWICLARESGQGNTARVFGGVGRCVCSKFPFWLIVAEAALGACGSLACGARTGLEGYAAERIAVRPGVVAAPEPSAAVPPSAAAELVPEVIAEPPPAVSSAAPSTTAMLAEGECEEGDVLIYLMTLQNELFVFDPDTDELTLRGQIACMAGGYEPYSMAVDRFGIAYVLFDDSYLYRVDSRTLECERTPYQRRAGEFQQFGMGFVRNLELEKDELFVTDIGPQGSAGLARIDADTWDLSLVGAYSESVGRMEMTGSSDGQLYGYATDQTEGGRILHIDKTNGSLLEQTPLPVGMDTTTLAFAYFRGIYYVFTGNGTTTDVSRYDPTNAELQSLGTLSYAVVGAGVSTCDLD